jgi:hypothetical protein
VRDAQTTNTFLLDFWASWCGPCRQIMPLLAEVAREYAGRGLCYVAVNLREEPDVIRRYLATAGIAPTVALDAEGQIAAAFQVRAIPTMVLIDPKGTVAWVHEGSTPDLKARLTEAVRGLLDQDQCVANLKVLGLAARRWAVDHGNVIPPDLHSMSNEVSSTQVLICPADTGRRAAADWAALTTNNVSYEFLAPSVPVPDSPGRRQRVVFRCPVHDNVACLDGAVRARPSPGAPDQLLHENGILYFGPPEVATGDLKSAVDVQAAAVAFVEDPRLGKVERRQAPERMSWKEREALLTEGSNLTAAQADAVNADLKRNPGNEAQWARLLGYAAAQSSQTNALPFAKVYARVVATLPASVLAEPSGMNLFSPLLSEESCFELAAWAWNDAARRYATNALVLRRAGQFLTASPVFDQHARQGEAFLEKAVALEPDQPGPSLELAEYYLQRAKPRFDDPDGDGLAARKALNYLEAAGRQLPEVERTKPAFLQKLTHAAFWAGNFAQGRTYAHDWLRVAAQLEQAPAPLTQNQRSARAADRGDAIHDANMILGEIALSEGRIKEAGGFLIEAGKATNGWTLTSSGPDLALANDLLDQGEREAVLTFFEECRVFWKLGHEQLSRWTQAVQAGRKPDFGSGFHFRFKRIQSHVPTTPP